jgi:hypothetical protein
MMFSYLGTFLGPVISAAKAWILLIVIVTVGGYVGYLNWQISSVRSEAERLKIVAVECQITAQELSVQNAIQADSLERIQAYYRNKKCLDLRDGQLSDEELKLR